MRALQDIFEKRVKNSKKIFYEFIFLKKIFEKKSSKNSKKTLINRQTRQTTRSASECEHNKIYSRNELRIQRKYFMNYLIFGKIFEK